MRNHLDRDEKNMWVQGLLVECPLNKALAECPLNEMRKLPLAERINIVKKMSDEDIDLIIEHHKGCITKREAKD